MRHVGGTVRLLALLGSFLSLVACQKQTELTDSGLPSPSSASVVATNAYPGVVMVSLPGGSGICTGTVVSDRAVLTAAHCVKNSGRYSVIGGFGTVSTYDVESYGPGVVDDPNDIAILIFGANTFDEQYIIKIGASVSSNDELRLVGFGCNSLTTRRGAGVKRTGTNVVYRVSDYVEFLTPNSSGRGILGPENRSGSCFGDSGGPALKMVGGELQVVAVTHAGGTSGNFIISQYVDVGNRSDNRNFIAAVNQNYSLGIAGF